MILDVDRWLDDPSKPTGREVRRDLGRRVAVPAIVVWLAVTGVGLLLVGPLDGVGQHEAAVNEWFVERRTDTLDRVTAAWTALGNTPLVIAVCAVVALLTLWRTRQWWYALVPVIAVTLQSWLFILAAFVVGRPRPDVPKLDDAPPTSSYPSGHSSASTALYVTLALMAQRIERTWLRVTVTVVVLLVPPCVYYARLYRGMHHPTDVAMGICNGLACAVIAWNWLRRTPARVEQPTAAAAVGSTR